MSSDFSIREAAKTHGSDLALMVGGTRYSYRELAQRCEDLELPTPNVHRASATLETALVLYASLEQQVPLCLLSAKASDEEFEKQSARLPERWDDDTALVLFTSGSDGLAKGVKLSRRALLASAQASEKRLPWFGDDRWLCALPLSHIGGLSILLRCLAARTCAYLCERFESREVLAALANHQVTHISLVPTMLWRLLEEGCTAPPHLRVCLMGGAAMAGELAARARAAGFPLHLSYGMSESASQVITDGVALEGVMLRVFDDCLEIKGPMLMNGYLPPHEPQALLPTQWFRTQDRARIDEEGRVTILGRADALIISGGENIDPREVEAGLNQHEAIADSFAFALPDMEWGQAIVALVVPSDAHATLAQVEAHALRGPLRPKQLVIVPALPLLENGKINRREAARLALAARAKGHHKAPQGPME